jgi:DNA-binding transcriptional LysR family regulator
MEIMNWFDSLETFIAVADNAGFAAGARALGLPASVVTKRIQWLESRLATNLLVRTTRQVTLTEYGEYLLKRATPLFESWSELRQEISDQQKEPSGQLTIAFAPDLAGLDIFASLLQKFSKSYPGISLRITTATPALDLINTQTDIMIAVDGYVAQPELTIRVPLFPFKYCCYASSHYLNASREQPTLTNLTQQCCLVYRDNDIWNINKKEYKISKAYSFDSGNSLLAACRAGLGIMYYPDFMISEDQDDLQQVFSSYSTKNETLCLYYTKANYQPQKISAFIKAVSDEVKS